MTPKEIELNFELLSMKISKLENEIEILKETKKSKTPSFSRNVENSPNYDLFKEAIEASVMNADYDDERIKASDVANYVREKHNVKISNIMCGKIMNKIFKSFKKVSNGVTSYNLKITDGTRYVSV